MLKNKFKKIVLKIIPKKIAHKFLYKKYMRKKLNLNVPQTLNEKIHWMILNYYGKKEGNLSDKNKVKAYINSLNIADLQIPKTIFTFNNQEEFYNYENNLPNKYVLKTNHGSGDVYIIDDNSKKNLNMYIKKLEGNLKENYENNKLEYHYSYIKPLIMVEEFLDDKKFERPMDYKFFCYDGFVDCVMVCSSRGKNIKKDFFDKNWKHLDYSKEKLWSYKPLECPKNFDKMLIIASKISKGFPFVRVDLYNIDGKIYFGEMTFTPAAGLSDAYTEKGDLHLGKYININDLKHEIIKRKDGDK